VKTSVVITVYNRAAALAGCLRALALCPQSIHEVVVSDDGSDPLERERMEALFARLPFTVRSVRQEHAGFRLAAARNNGFRAASGDYVISLDCDIVLLPDAIRAHLSAAQPGRFLAGNRAMLSESDTARLLNGDIACNSLSAYWRAADRSNLGRAHRQFQRNRLLRLLGLARRHKPKILGCHFSLFREDLLKVNGFDERFVGWGLEDVDFALRLHMAGIRPRSVILKARAIHLWHAPSGPGANSPAGSPNLAYFRRPDIPARCELGISKKKETTDCDDNNERTRYR